MYAEYWRPPHTTAVQKMPNKYNNIKTATTLAAVAVKVRLLQFFAVKLRLLPVTSLASTYFVHARSGHFG